MNKPVTPEELEAVNPFNESHLEQLEQAERKLEVFFEQARKAETCGIECTTQRQLAGEIQRVIRAIKKEFFAKHIKERITESISE